MMNSSMLSNLQQNLSRIAKYQEQIERKTKINRPSDDPTGTSQTLSLQSNINLNNQYQRNITNGLAWLVTADSSLSDFYESLATARTDAIKGVNGIMEQSNYNALAAEVDALLDQLVTYANTSLGNYYLFAGQKNKFAPFFRLGDNFTYTGDTQKVLRDISPNGRFPINANGYNTFYKKLQSLEKGPGSTVKTVDIESQQHRIGSFGAVVPFLTPGDPSSGIDTAYLLSLGGTLTLNIDGKDFNINFSGPDGLAKDYTAQEMVDRINSVIGLNGVAYCNIDSMGCLVVESTSINHGKFISVNRVDDGLGELKLLAGFNNLQYGKYKVSTIDNASPADSKALVTDVYSQMTSTIVTNVGVTDPGNQYNSSILMEVINVNFTNEFAEINGNFGGSFASIEGKSVEIVVDNQSRIVTFSDINSNQDIVNQINEALGSQNAARVDASGNITIRSQTVGSDSKIEIKEISPVVATELGLDALNVIDLGFYDGQSGAVGLVDATVRFTYHTYDKDGNRYNGVITQTFKDDVDPKNGLASNPPNIWLGDSTAGFELAVNLTGFIRTGDKAVISVTAQGVVDDDAIIVNYDGQDRKYIFNSDAYGGAFDGVDAITQMKFFSIDVGNGEIYDGTIDLSFTSAGLGDANNAASFTAGNMFDMMVYLRKKLENMEVDKVEQMEFYFDEMMDIILQEQVKIGATTRQFEAVNVNYLYLKVNLGQMLSDYYETDLPLTIVRLEEVLNAYKASLYSTSLISQTKLLDYLR